MVAERWREHITKLAGQQRGLRLGVDRDGVVAPVPWSSTALSRPIVVAAMRKGSEVARRSPSASTSRRPISPWNATAG